MNFDRFIAWVIFLAMVLLSGCSTAPCASGGCELAPEPPGAREAARLAWAAYGEAGELPGLTYVARGDCPDGRFLTSDGCESGTYRESLDHAWISLASTEGTWREILAHELLHAHLLREFGDADGQHRRPEWVSAQRAALGAMGE